MAKKRKKITENHQSHTGQESRNIIQDFRARRQARKAFTDTQIKLKEAAGTKRWYEKLLWAPKPGEPYVYFTDLLNSHMELYRDTGEEQAVYARLYSDMYSGKYDSLYSSQEQTGTLRKSTITESNTWAFGSNTLIDFLEHRAQAEAAMEKNFFDQLRRMMFDQEKNLPEEALQILLLFLDEYESASIKESTYYKLVTIFNNLHLFNNQDLLKPLSDLQSWTANETKELEEFLKTELDPKEGDAEFKQKYEKAIKSKNKSYLYRVLKEQLLLKNKDINLSFTRQLESKTKIIFEKLGSSQKFKNTVKQLIIAMKENGNFNIDKIISGIQSYIITAMKKELNNLLRSDDINNFIDHFYGEFNTKNIENIIQEITTSTENETISNLSILGRNQYQTLMNMIINKEKDLANVLLELQEKNELNTVLQQANLQNYTKEILQYLDNIKTVATKSQKAYAKGQLTQYMRTDNIINQVKEVWNDQKEAAEKELHAIELITSVSVNVGGWAELFTTDALTDLCLQAIATGQLSNRKADVRFIISYDFMRNAKTAGITSRQEQRLEALLNKFPQMLIEEQLKAMPDQQNSSAAVNLRANARGYQNAKKKLEREIKLIFGKDVKKAEQILQGISSIIIGSISVKDYNVVSTKAIGFGAGGTGGSMAQSMRNISDVYKLTGLNIPQDILAIAALNCGQATIGNTLFANTLQQIVSGAVIDLLLDDNFTNIKQYYDQIKNDIITTSNTDMQGVHLFRLNGYLIPASYLYYMFANGIKQQANLITDAFYKITPEDTVAVELYQPISTKHIPQILTTKKEKSGTSISMMAARNRWNYITAKATKLFHMRIHFAKGILETLNNLPDYAQLGKLS